MFPKFKLINSITKEVLGFEWLTVDGWQNDVFGPRDGTFDQREFGQDFLGIVIRRQFIYSKDRYGNEIFDGDTIQAPSGNLFTVQWHDEQMRWVMTDGSKIYNINCGLFSVLP